MRIIIDLQGAQASNKNRGIGRYCLSITKSIIKQKKEHEIIVVLSNLFLEEIASLKEELKEYLDEEHIYIWNTPQNIYYIDINHTTRRKNAEYIRETFIASLNPDIVLVTSLFEGLIDDAVTSIGLLKYTIPTAVILYDLIPLIHPSPYLDNPDVKKWYEEKINHLKKANLLLSISESSRQEALDYLNIPQDSVINIGTASDSQFKKIVLSQTEKTHILNTYHLEKDFLMYTGGIDHRKNIEGLIRSYALLNKSIRDEHQLAIVCSINDEQEKVLRSLAHSKGLSDDEVIFTGYIPESDLIALYNLCKAFIFPSWHEGFGLPVLEAMNCGAPVIVSNRSSLPEVVGYKEALFDSKNDTEMSQKIKQILTNKNFRDELKEHHQKQIEKFSWDYTGSKAMEALEHYYKTNKNNLELKPKKRLAYISPLPPERSGISDYSAELLQSLIKYYKIDVIIEQENISDDWITKHCPTHTVEWFKSHASEYDRVLYHFGNSHFHQHMFALLYEYPGTVVLHDFFLSGVLDYMNILKEEVFYSHGYKTIKETPLDRIWNYPANKRVLDHAKGVIVHSQNSIHLAKKWYGETLSKHWSIIPLLRAPSKIDNSKDIRKKLNIPEDAFIVCSFGLLGSTKQNQKLLDAWSASTLSKNKNSYLIFVGKNDTGEYGLHLEKTIKNSKYTSQVKITGWADINTFRDYLSVADIGVQLRTKSRGETSAAVLDCMNYGLATIVNANGSMADLDNETVYKLKDEFTIEDLRHALEDLYFDTNKRKMLSQQARDCIINKHAPEKCAKQYFEAIENFYQTIINEKPHLLDAIAKNSKQENNIELKKIANSIAKNHPYAGQKQLFIDISQLVTVDDKSGIQRVVKSILNQLLLNSSEKYRIEPVYATANSEGYRYARNFTYTFLNCQSNDIVDKIIDFKKGDIFLGLDLSHTIPLKQANYYKLLRTYGIKTYFIVYDMLPILQPQHFVDGAEKLHTNWLNVIKESNGAICISESVKNELKEWLKSNPSTNKSFIINAFHLGADIKNDITSKGVPENSQSLLKQLSIAPSFLMVGTIEPRKGHKQTLDAFEKLWDKGIEVNLAIVGKEGWLVEELTARLKKHPQLEKQLFWLEGISDEYLEKIYATSTCLIAASEGEGFGLPLIEAAQKKMPIIARDIPVFREVAGEYAYYFKNSKNPEVMAKTIEKWIELYKEGNHPKSCNMPWLTWEESTKQLLNVLRLE